MSPNEPERNAIGRTITFTIGDAPSDERISAARPKPMPANAAAPSTSAPTSEAQASGSSAS